MSKTDRAFSPSWYEETAPQGSYRSIFKWGNLNVFKHPNRGLYELVKHTFNMTDEDFRQPRQIGLERVEFEAPVRLKTSQVNKLCEIVGNENVRMDSYSRLRAAYGEGTIDSIRLRNHVIENFPDIVLCPRDSVDIEKIVTYCNDQKIPLYVYGGGTSVTRGFEAVKGGVTLDMGVHLNKVVDFSETDQTITVQAGMMGPELEKLLNNAPEHFGAQRSYTCGHFPIL
ncbi:MAG: FAD-binding oxidoreductase [Anaerolineales bacterium]|nr:FAD-binding oxidoreductase [Anaerolineales bacterium]